MLATESNNESQGSKKTTTLTTTLFPLAVYADGYIQECRR